MIRFLYLKTSCESGSIDKVVNQDNMNYGDLSFKKSQLRAKDLKGETHTRQLFYNTYSKSIYCSTSTNII